MRACIAAILLLCACGASVCGADEFGSVLFQTPEGWTRVQQADSMLLIPRDLPKGFVFTMAIRKGEELNGRTLRQFLDDRLKAELVTGGSVVSSAPIQEGKIESGAELLSTTRIMSTREGRHFLAQYFVIVAGSRGVMISVISNSEELVKKHAAVIGRFIATLTFK